MPAVNTVNLTKNYKSTLKGLKERLVRELGAKLFSIILYGSVARGDFGTESDIDLLLLLDDKTMAEKAYEIGYEVDIQYNTVTSILIYSPEEIRKNLELGSPFANNVITEGKIIYDNGNWERLHNNLIRAS